MSLQSPEQPAPRRLGIFGGTFNPVHYGHLHTVRQLLQLASLDQVRYVPASVPPHRAAPGVSATHRLEMVRIATSDDERMVADQRELDREGPSYTFDTILSFRDEFPDTSLFLILGLDALLAIPHWHRFEELLDAVNILAMVRPGWQQPQPLPTWWSERQAKHTALDGPETGKISLVPVTPLSISSTSVRDALASGKSVTRWLHPGVLQYIRKYNLYDQTPT